ncbi:MAG: YqaA family protein [Prolixibacteraceae bacterium]|jgi:membrane protein YqaA with SNARE-associated domain|nr:YqaA family protein [Prolixibacteraceae bacterium]
MRLQIASPENPYFRTMEFLYEYGLTGLFLASFLAATVLPFSSEALLSLLIAGHFDTAPCIAVATLGNWMGGMSSYYLGYIGKWEWIEKYLRVRRKKIEQWHNLIYNRGAVFAFFSWLPVLGDVFAVGLGVLRANWKITAIAMLSGKFLRYLVWGWLSGMLF